MMARLQCALLCLLCACAGPRESADSTVQREEPTAVRLAAAKDEVRSIQLYAANQADLPILSMRSGGQLTLKFDLLNTSPRSLSVYFYHADRSWLRDLDPSEYLTTFQRDDLFDYSLSRATTVEYTHYTYSFPNTSIDFRVSGNYVLRVTEQGQEQDVLFERPFYVVENAMPVRFAIDRVLSGRQVLPTVQPIARFIPPDGLAGSAFDFAVCFARNGRFQEPRCTSQPSLADQPSLFFYLEPEESFSPQEGDYYLDIRNLVAGAQIERVDRSVLPIEMLLAPDYARFPTGTWQPHLQGQPVIAASGYSASSAAVQGEYIDVIFRYVPPDEKALPGGLFVVGSFSGWSVDLGNELRWNAAEGWYETSLLLKQGQYEYRYTSPDPAVRSRIATRVSTFSDIYSVLVYFRDIVLGTDRLLTFGQVRDN